jgi:periplasmic protein TonB
MKYRKLNLGVNGVISVFVAIITMTACNNSDKSEKTSTATATNSDTSASVDTSNKMPATTATTTARKKGRVTTSVAANNKNAGNTTMKMDKMGFYDYTEVPPAFAGGQSALEDYITNHIEYPQQAIDNNVEGTVNIQFTIDENGKVGNAKATGDKLGYGLEDAAVQVISQMPKWTPGKIKGKNVKAWYTLPVTYKIEE